MRQTQRLWLHKKLLPLSPRQVSRPMATNRRGSVAAYSESIIFLEENEERRKKRIQGFSAQEIPVTLSIYLHGIEQLIKF